MKSIFGVYANGRMFLVLLLGFASGVPLGLTGGTLQAWMTDAKVDLTIIGLASLIGLPYTLKFLWAPLMDRFVPPFLGRRRGWMLVTQLGLMGSLSWMALFWTPPGGKVAESVGEVAMRMWGLHQPVQIPFFQFWLELPVQTFMLAQFMLVPFLVAIFSASQDIVIDAYRTELLPNEEQGAGSAVYILGYRIAMLVSGALALIMADHLSWTTVYLIMAGTLMVGVVATLLAPEPVAKTKPPTNLRDAVVLPFIDYFRRKGALEILLFIVIYKLDVVIASSLSTPFLLQMGFSKTAIGTVNKGFGLVATIVGTLVGGAFMRKLGIYRSLWMFGILQGVSGLTFALLASMGSINSADSVQVQRITYMMIAAIAVENFCSGMGTAAYSAFMASLCNRRFTATQYALLTSLMAVSRVVAGSGTGWLAKSVGWVEYFMISIAVSIPGLLLLLRYDRWQQVEEEPLALE